jgi:hypothetical protein
MAQHRTSKSAVSVILLQRKARVGAANYIYAPLPTGYDWLPDRLRYRTLDAHRSGQYVVMEGASNQTLPRAAVWDRHSGAIVYAPPGAWLIGLGGDGSSVITLGYADADGEESGLQPRIPQEFWFEHRTWPQTKLVSSCTVRLYSGWPHSFIASPHNNLVVIRTMDQEIGGYAALSSRPGYSPDSRYAVSGYHTTFAARRVGQVSYEVPLTQAGFEVGSMTVVDINGSASREIVVVDAVPSGIHTAARERLDPPVFVDNEHFAVTFVTGETRAYTVRE